MKTHGVQHVLSGKIKQDARLVFFHMIDQIFDDNLDLFTEFGAYLVAGSYANGHVANLLKRTEGKGDFGVWLAKG